MTMHHTHSGAALPEHAPRLFRIYNHYRIVIGLILVTALLWDPSKEIQNYVQLDLYRISASTYLALHIFIGFLLMAGLRPGLRHVTTSLLVDILLLVTLVYSSTGLTSGYSNLLVVSVAAGNILIQGRLGIFLAAIAALGILGVAVAHLLQGTGSVETVIRAGLFGILYFATAFLIQSITRRMLVSEQLAQARARDILELEKLNHQIIQRMLTGIIVADTQGRVRLINEAARDLLGDYDPDAAPDRMLPLELLERLFQWRINPSQRISPMRISHERAAVQASFASLNKSDAREVLIFLEDTSKITQQAQQMKLASLGRLTAGIAHEIRNPLGAISHAGQLLLESPSLTDGDRKMGEIILRHSKRMNGIIENVLQLSRRKAPEAELLDINQWLEHYIEDYTACGTTSAQINLRKDPIAPQGRFDPSQLAQVIANLFGNGLRYSEQQTGKAVVHVETGVTAQEQAYVDVIDEGPGISADSLEHLFEPFFTTDQQGTGLGLYISRELCEANQAQLDCLPRPQGCQFRVTFAHPQRTT